MRPGLSAFRGHVPQACGDINGIDGGRARVREALDRTVDDDLADEHTVATQPFGEQACRLGLRRALEGDPIATERDGVAVDVAVVQAQRTVDQEHRGPIGGKRSHTVTERNRRRILDAATHVFAVAGPSATLNDVATAAGVGIGTIYRKFSDKEALLDALLEDKIETVIQVAVNAATIDDPGAAFRTYLHGMLAVHAADRSLATIMFGPHRNERFRGELAHRLAEAADGLIAAAIAAGELRSGFTKQDTTVLAVMVGTIAAAARGADPDVWRRYAQLVVDGTRPTAHTDPLAPDPLSFVSTAEALGRTL